MPKNDIRGALRFLAEKQGGEIQGFYKDEKHGSVDLIWGNLKGGLQHMIDKHVGYNGDKMKDFATVEELADEI
ncbi:MAG: hypothetical protein LUC91_05175, partial [Prevotella sp.]|nr:hypothetical protein [Prevotella sp.]